MKLFISSGIQLTHAKTSNALTSQLPAFAEKYVLTSLGENVFVFDSGMDMQEIQALIDTIFIWQSGRSSEFTKSRFALLFKPGTYELDAKLGYCMQILGLGEYPEDVVIMGAFRSNTRGESVVRSAIDGKGDSINVSNRKAIMF